MEHTPGNLCAELDMSRPRRARANAATAPPAALPAELPDELWALMFAIDDEVAASCYSLNRQLNALANQSLLSRAVLPPRVRRLTEQETCVMADLIETLALSADKVKRGATYTTRRRFGGCLLYTSPSPRDLSTSRMPSSA